MATKFKQIAVVTMANIRSLGRRSWISASMILSIALVVVVLVGFLAMARGFETALAAAGSDRVAVVLAGGARDEKGSSIPVAVLHQIAAVPPEIGLALTEGEPVVSAELVVPVDARLAGSTESQTVGLRGLGSDGPGLRPNVKLTAGRFAQPGAAEIVVGADIQRRYDGFGLGQTVTFGATRWTVVGTFEAGGAAFESEIWADLGVVQALFKREGEIQSLRVALAEGKDGSELARYLEQTLSVPVTVMTEKAYFSDQSRRVSQMIRMFGWPIALVMAIGAAAGALNTMLSSVSDRSVEIATLRAIGFSGLAAFVGTWIEALLLSAIGAAVGAAISLVLLNGWQASTLGGGGQIAFDLQVSADILGQAILLALVIGIIGGALPAIKAARMPLIKAMRAMS